MIIIVMHTWFYLISHKKSFWVSFDQEDQPSVSGVQCHPWPYVAWLSVSQKSLKSFGGFLESFADMDRHSENGHILLSLLKKKVKIESIDALWYSFLRNSSDKYSMSDWGGLLIFYFEGVGKSTLKLNYAINGISIVEQTSNKWQEQSLF